MSQIKKMNPKSVGLISIIIIILFLYFWYTRPLNIPDLINGQQVLSVSLMNQSHSFDLENSALESCATTDMGEIQRLFQQLESYQINRRISVASLIGMPYILGAPGPDGQVYSYLFIDVKNSQNKIDTITITVVSNPQTSADGKMTLKQSGKKVPAGIGRFGQEKSIQFQQTLQGFLEACVDNPLWEHANDSELNKFA